MGGLFRACCADCRGSGRVTGPQEGPWYGTACGDRRLGAEPRRAIPLSAFRWASFVQASPGIRLGFHPNDIFRTDSE